MPERSVVMAKYEYTVKYNGRKYYPGEDVPIDENKTESVAVAEKVAVAEAVVEEPVESIVTEKPVLVKETEKKSKGRKPKA